MKKMGLLFVVSETPAAFEEEFNAWYDTEHVPERLALPGFLSGSRYVSAERPRRYLALYDLENVGVLDRPEYQAFAGENFTPWTKRVLARTRVTRLVARQAAPGDVTRAAARLTVLRFTEAGPDMAGDPDRIVAALGASATHAQVRGFTLTEPEANGRLVTVAGPEAGRIDTAALGDDLARLSMCETFLPY